MSAVGLGSEWDRVIEVVDRARRRLGELVPARSYLASEAEKQEAAKITGHARRELKIVWRSWAATLVGRCNHGHAEAGGGVAPVSVVGCWTAVEHQKGRALEAAEGVVTALDV